MKRVSHNVQAFLEPLAVEVATKGCTEVIWHASRRLVKERRQDKSYGMLQIVLNNVVTIVNRQAILSVVRREFSELFHCLNLCYN